jgi:hypothetical protein
MVVIERDGYITEIKTDVTKQFSSEYVNSLEWLDNLG